MFRGKTRWMIAVLILEIFILMTGPAQAAETGEEIFARICKVCHTIGQGKLVGPDLAGVSTRYDPEWIIPFVQSSQTVIKSGDPVAVARFEEFNKLIMPDNPVSRSEVLSIIAYIEATAGDPASGDEVRPTPLDTATDTGRRRSGLQHVPPRSSRRHHGRRHPGQGPDQGRYAHGSAWCSGHSRQSPLPGHAAGLHES